MKKNISGQFISAKMLTLADGTAYTGSVTVYVDIDGASQATGAGTVTHKGNGVHEYEPTQAETNGDFISFSFVGTATIDPTIQVYTNTPQSADHTTAIADIPTTSEFNARSLPSADYFVVSDYTAPNNSDITAILTDTNELQTNQGNWITATGFATSSALSAVDVKVDNIPTVSEFNARTLPSANYFDFANDSVKLSTTQPSITFQPMTITATGTQNNLTLSGSGSGDGLMFSRSGTADLFGTNWLSALESAVWDATAASYTSTGTTGEALGDVLTIGDYTAPDNASITSILSDTDELQSNQGNWVTATGFSTSAEVSAVSTKVDNVPTVSEFNARTIPSANYFDPSTDSVDIGSILGTTLAETTTSNIADNISTFFDNADSSTSKVVDDVGTAVSGGGEFTTTEKNQLRFRLGLDGTTATPSATPDLSTQASIDALNDFDPSTDIVARVTLVDTTTVNTDMRGTDSAASAESLATLDGKVGDIQGSTFDSATDSLEAIRDRGDSAWVTGSGGGSGGLTAQETRDAMKLAPTAGTPAVGSIDAALDSIEADTSELQGNQGDWATATGFSTFDPDSDTVARVTLVDTTTTNSDMRGTNSALLAADYTAPNNSGITSIIASISGLNDLSFDDIWTGQLTESYAVKGQAPTPTQALMMNQQFLTDFGISTTSYSVKGLDGTTTVATFTLDDDANPTSIERAS